MAKRIGYTGTRYGMTDAQRLSVQVVVGRLVEFDERFEAHHGDCVGGDSEFHDIVDAYPNRWLVGHPGPADDVARQAGRTFDVRLEPAPHMKRNRAIVIASTVMIAAPYDDVEQAFGGTWKTIRMARQLGRPLIIVARNGDVRYENWLQ